MRKGGLLVGRGQATSWGGRGGSRPPHPRSVSPVGGSRTGATEENVTRRGQLRPQFQDPLASERELAEAKVDYDRFFDILMLPTQSPLVSKREELKLVEVDEDKFFRKHVRSAEHYHRLIRAQAARKTLAEVQRTFQNMQKHGIVPTLEIYTSMVAACAKKKEPLEAEKYLVQMQEEGVQPNIWTYTALAHAYTRAGQLDAAFKVLERIKDAGIRPNVVLYSSLIHGCLLSNDVDRAWDTFDHMRQREAIEPDEVAFTLMINACAKKAQVERAQNLMEEMQLLQLQPTEVTYNTNINACARRRDYYTEAFLNLERMKAAGFRPDVVTYSTLLHASAKNGDVKMAEVVFKSMNDSGMLVVKPDTTRIWNSLLSAYANAQPHADALVRGSALATASRVLHSMKEVGQPPDLYTANCLLSLYARSHRIRCTEALFDAAFHSSRSLSTDMPNASADDNAEPQDSARAGKAPPSGSDLWVFEERFTPDVVSYTCLIQLYAETRRPEKALHVWQLMRDSGVEPNMRTYQYMVQALARSGYLTTTMKLLREMRGKGFIPSHQVTTLLMQRTTAFPELRDEVRRLTEIPLPTNVDKNSILAIRLRRASRRDRDPFAPQRRVRSPLHRPV